MTVAKPSDTPPSPSAEPTEIDAPTRARIAVRIAEAITAELGEVRISSMPPPESAPRSSMRAAAKVGGKLGKWGVLASGALSLAGTAIAIFVRPEYATPLAQALKLFVKLIEAMGGGGAPSDG